MFTFLLGVGKYIRPLFLFSAWDVHSSAVTLNFIRLLDCFSLSLSLFFSVLLTMVSLLSSLSAYYLSSLSLFLSFLFNYFVPFSFSLWFSINNFSIFLLSLISLSAYVVFLSFTLSRMIHWRHGYRPEIPRLALCIYTCIHVEDSHVYIAFDMIFYLIVFLYIYEFHEWFSRIPRTPLIPLRNSVYYQTISYRFVVSTIYLEFTN